MTNINCSLILWNLCGLCKKNFYKIVLSRWASVQEGFCHFTLLFSWHSNFFGTPHQKWKKKRKRNQFPFILFLSPRKELEIRALAEILCPIWIFVYKILCLEQDHYKLSHFWLILIQYSFSFPCNICFDMRNLIGHKFNTFILEEIEME